MVEAAYILLTNITDEDITSTPEYEAAILALSELLKNG